MAVGHIQEPLNESPLDLINNLLGCENDENNNLIQILGIVKPTKVSQTSITSLIRGLFTKNKNLLKLLHQHKKTFDASLNNNDDKQAFKTFINDFILWVNDDVLLLFNKYKTCLETSSQAENSMDNTYFNKPIMHLTNYITFVESASKIIRNPYVLEQLEQFRMGCLSIVETYLSFIEKSNLDNIAFNQVQLFGETNNIKNFSDNVCSYFKITQIVDRTRSSRLVIDNSKTKPRIELLLLNLNGVGSQQYNSLAIVAIPKDQTSRSLMFPPFRLNELSLTYSSSKCQLILNSIHFSKNTTNVNDSIVINCPDEDFLADWVRKLSVIFPLENPDSPLNPSFVLKLSTSDLDLKMSGLGIDMLSDNSELSDPSDMESSEKPGFKELIESPSLPTNLPPSLGTRYSPPPTTKYSPPPSTRYSPPPLRTKVSSTSTNSGFHQPRIPQFVKGSSELPSPVSSLQSMDTVESYHTANGVKVPKSSHLKVQNIPSGFVVQNSSQDRPKSSTAEVVPNDKENIDPLTKLKNVSAPNLPLGTKTNDIYKLSTGSEINISNFGRNHNPSFSIHNGLSEIVNEAKPERPKSKLFSMFKKNKSNSSINSKNLKINTQIPFESDSDTIPQSATSVVSAVSTISQSSNNNKNASGSAFALPSSTSTYFFKPYATNNSASVTDLSEGVDLKIPQSLKDTINDDNTVDFYISPTSKKTMKVSKWKPKYGKWEMLTVNESIFLKLVVNYELGCGWLLVFEEQLDQESNEIIDKPILIVDINNETEITQSSALDIQISAKNSISNETILVMVRCFSNELTQSVGANIKNVKGAVSPKKLFQKSSQSSFGNSRQTMNSSVMDYQAGVTSKSSTSTSVSSLGAQKPNLTRDFSMVSIRSEDINNANILNNPDNTKLLLLNDMTIRLQKNVDNNESVTSPSSWKILSMYSLSIHIISDFFTGKNYFNFTLTNNTPTNGEKDHGWLVCEDEKFDRIQRIGKAGLLINVSEDDLFMIECKGKREIKELFEVF